MSKKTVIETSYTMQSKIDENKEVKVKPGCLLSGVRLRFLQD